MWFNKLLAFLDAITFPVVILILVPALVWLFRKELKHRLSKSPIFFPGGGVIGAPTLDDTPEILRPPPLSNPALEQRVASLSQLLKQSNVQDREHALLEALAISQFSTIHEQIYRNIYASQIKVLKALNESNTELTITQLPAPPLSVSLAGAQAYDSWRSYLINTGLATLEGQHMTISDAGKLFLIYITEQGYPESGLYPDR